MPGREALVAGLSGFFGTPANSCRVLSDLCCSAFTRSADATIKRHYFPSFGNPAMQAIARAVRPLLWAVTFVCLTAAARADDSPCPPTVAQLKKMSVCELDRLFEQATPGELPVGHARGRVLLMTDARLPRVRACLASAVWKGKTFDECGGFINQFPGFQALEGAIAPGVSTYDGKPCLILEYPPGTPVFGNLRDEMRQVGPGLYLARLYEVCPCLHFRGYFVIQVDCACPKICVN